MLLLLTLAACGGSVDFFPAYKRLPTTPDAFTFTNKVGVVVGTSVPSNTITVNGLTSETSPISVTGSTGSASKFSINGAAATDAAGQTVKNKDTVTVTHTASTATGAATTSTLTIGNVSATFTSVTQTVLTPAFAATATSGVSSATITSNDTVGPHTISISGANAQFEITDINNTVTIGFTASPQSLSILNGFHILLSVPAVAGTTTLTIDNTNYQIDNVTLAVTAAPK
jgi:hypothetical protein